MYCPKCGNDNLEDAKQCQSCGQPIAPPQTPNSEQKASKLALWSFILSILSPFTCLITAIPALICGILGLVEIRKSKGQLIGTVNAITGLVITIGVVLLALFLPMLGKIHDLAPQKICGTNLSSLGKAMLTYTNDYNDVYPPADKWCDLLIEKAKVEKYVFVCPASDTKFDMSSYAFNLDAAGKKTSEIPPDMVLIFETDKTGWNMAGGKELLSKKNHKGYGCNVLFADGHVKFIKDPNSLRWTAK